MAEFQAGEVVVPVVPSAQNFNKDLKRQVLAGAYPLGQGIGKEIQRGISDQLKGVYEPLKEQAAKQRQQAANDGAASGGAYAQAFKRAVEAAARSLPKVTLDADSSPAQRKVAELRARLETLSSRTVGLDIDAGAARAELASIEAELRAVDGKNVSVDVRADIGAALAEIAGVEAAVSRLNGRTANVNVNVDSGPALAQIAMVSSRLVALGALGGTVLAGVAAAAAPAALGLAGIAAVAVPAVGRINEALQAQEQAGNAAARGLSAAAGATRNLVIEQAQAQIRALQAANAAETLAQAQDRVKEASAGVSEAKARLKQAVQSAGQAQVAAAQRAASAERSLADAQRQAIRAQEDLNKARKEAIKYLEDVSRSLRGNALDQREAALDLKDAEADLAAAQRGGNASEIERASIAYERAKLRAEELKAQQEKLNEEQAKGVEGNDRVVAAKEAVEQANQRVIDQERALAQAYAESGKAGEEAAKKVADARKAVADAQKRVDDAKAAVERVKRDQKIAELQEKIRKEQEKQQAAATRVPAAQATAAQKKAELSPAELKAMKEIQKFQDSYKKFQQDLGSAVLPVVTSGLKIVQALFKPLTPLIKATAKALLPLEKAATKALGGKFWTDFFKTMTSLVPESVGGIGKMIGDIIVGFAGIIKAAAPLVPVILNVLGAVTGAFADLGKNLSKDPGFAALVDIVKAVFGTLVSYWQNVVGPVIIWLWKYIVTPALQGIAAVVTWAWENVIRPALNLFGQFLREVVGPALQYFWQNVVVPAWDGIVAAVQQAWTNWILPALQNMVTFWQTVLAPAITWLWQNVIVPAWDGISAAIKWAWENLIKPAVAALVLYWKTILGPAISWLWNNIVKPAWDAIGKGIKVAWESIIKPAVQGLVTFWKTILGPAISWLWENVVKPAWSAIGEGIKTAWEKVIKPAVSALWTFVTDTLPKGFKAGVELIGKFWDGLKKIAAAPVEFVVNTVYNNGIRAVWNAVAKALKLSELPELKFSGFARGGIYPGYTPGRDVGMAAVSGGEAIMRPEWTRAVGSDYVHGANAAARKGGVGGVQRFMGGFASGGIVGDFLANGVKFAAEKVLNPILDRASKAMGDSPWAQMLVGVPKTLVKGVVDFLVGEEGKQGGPGAAKALAFAREQLGKPYVWGGTGPNGFDCSGLTMRSWQAGGRGDIPRTSQQQMAWVEQVDKPVPGALGFPHPGHVWLYVNPKTIIEAPQTGLQVRQVAARAADVIGVPPTQYDSGGYLPTGHSLVYNGTGSPERVLTDQQWQALSGGSRGGDSPMVNIEGDFVAQTDQTPQQIAQELAWLGRSR